MTLSKTPSLDDLMAALQNIEGSRSTPAPSMEDLFDTAEGGDYTKWRMPPNTPSALVSTKVEAARGPSVSWCKPGDYKTPQKIYVKNGGTPVEVFPTDLIGTVVGCEVRPYRRGNHGEPPTSSVFGICKGGTCLRTLPSLETGILSTIYEYSDNEDSKYTTPSKELGTLKWTPVTPEGLLVDMIREGRSTAPIIKQDGTPGIAAFENRGMCYAYP
jgi:hypothetical protein